MRVLDHYPVLLLDLNGTFMFDGDRFGEAIDFYTAYQALGGKALSQAEVNHLIRTCHSKMMQDYRNPARYDDFPSVAEGLRQYACAAEDHIPLLEQVFTLHELGTVTEAYVNYLQHLSQTHRLALVSNIWAAKSLWLKEFERAGILDAFERLIFSSDSRSIKPSPILYQQALTQMNALPSEALFIGDSLRCDIEGAKAVGIATVWISEATEIPACADYVIPDLLQIDRLLL